MTTKPTLIPASPGRAVRYRPTNVDYNNDILQNGNYIQEVLAGTNADKIPTTAIVANPGFAGTLGVGGASTPSANLLQGGTLSPASTAFVNGLNQVLTLKPTAAGGNVIFASVGAAVDTSAAGGAVAGGFGLFVAAVTKTGANALTNAFGAFITIPTGGTNNVGLAFSTPAGAIAQETATAPTLTNSFTNIGGGQQTARYFRDTQGVVHVEGVVTHAAGLVGGTLTPIFTLAVGYRPAANRIFVANATGGFGEVRILTDGTVNWNIGTTTYFSLDGITFDTR